MLTLISEKYGLVKVGEFNSWGNIHVELLIFPGLQAELVTVKTQSDDRIEFKEIPWPYTLIFIFGYSVVLYLSGSLKKEIHDRGGHMFFTMNNSYKIRFQKNRQYIIFSIHYSSDFIRQNLEETAQSIRTLWELRSPVFYYTRARIVKRFTIEQLSMLMLPDHPDLLGEFTKGELARSIVMDFLNEVDISFQPFYIGAAQFEEFYEERNRLIQIALNENSISELLFLSGIKQVPLFRKRLRQLYDMNIREFITELRMTVAMKLLKDPTLSIKEIAARTGFSNAFYFSRVFTNYFGQPPKAFRSTGNF